MLEATRGSSNKPPGTTLIPADPTQRPSLQILSANNLGNGSVAVCDTGAPPQGGGVPGVNPPDFRAGQSITDALVDMSCRFSWHATSSVACTLNRLGDFAFLSSKTQMQYCFDVPLTVVFPAGDTLVAGQVLDTSGNIGPRAEIIVRVIP